MGVSLHTCRFVCTLSSTRTMRVACDGDNRSRQPDTTPMVGGATSDRSDMRFAARHHSALAVLRNQRPTIGPVLDVGQRASSGVVRDGCGVSRRLKANDENAYGI